MAYIYIPVPYTTALELLEYPVQGEKEDVATMHVTLVSFDQDMTDAEIARIQAVMQPLHRVSSILAMQVKRIGCFPSGSHGCPIIGHIEGVGIHKLQGSLRYLLDRSGIEYSKKFPVYRPHTTLSYAKDPISDRTVAPIEWTAGSMIFDTGSRRERKTLHTYFFQKH